MIEEMRPEVGYDALAGRGREVTVAHDEEPLDEEQRAQFGDGGVQRGGVPLNEDGVHEPPDNPEDAEVNAGRAHDEQRGRSQAKAVRAERGKEPTERG